MSLTGFVEYDVCCFVTLVLVSPFPLVYLGVYRSPRVAWLACFNLATVHMLLAPWYIAGIDLINGIRLPVYWTALWLWTIPGSQSAWEFAYLIVFLVYFGSSVTLFSWILYEEYRRSQRMIGNPPCRLHVNFRYTR